MPPSDSFADVMARAEKLRSGRTPFVLATVVRVQRPTSAKPGDCALLLPDGTLEGDVMDLVFRQPHLNQEARMTLRRVRGPK